MSTNHLDQTIAPRKGEELDTPALQAYLQQELGLRGALEIKQFPGGFSNLTYLLRAEDKEFVLRRPPFGANIKSAHDMGREYTALSHLQPVYNKAPRPLLYCETAGLAATSKRAPVTSPKLKARRSGWPIIYRRNPDPVCCTMITSTITWS